jgi:hypothetical protein
MNTSRSTQRGQMLPIFAGGLILLMAMTALVTDLGFSFMLRRQEQNAADPGALAAARYIPQGAAGRAAMWTAACFYAQQNGFIARRTDNSASCVGGAPTDGSSLTVNYPPSRNAGSYAGNPKYVEVVVTKPHSSFFAGVVGIRSFDVSSSAVAAFDDGTAGASSLVALNDTACASGHLHGGGGSGGGVNIFPGTGVTPGSGGFVQVNSICGFSSGANDNCLDGSSGGLKIDGGTTVTSNTIYIQGGCVVNGGSATINAPVDERSAYAGDPLAQVRPPNPTDLPTRQCPTGPVTSPTNPKTCNVNGTVTLDPGTYYGGWNIGRGTTLTLNPGIYVLAGGGISQTGGITAASGRVLIYGTDSPVCTAGAPNAACQQKLDFTGTSSLNLRGLDKGAPCLPYGSPGCPYGGLLFWQDAHASGAGTPKANIELEGSGSLFLEGTIYSAGGTVVVSGNGLGTGCTPDALGQTNCAAVQVIADSFDVGGSGMLAMPYNPALFYDIALKGLVK